jgi:hypothetical protein
MNRGNQIKPRIRKIGFGCLLTGLFLFGLFYFTQPNISPENVSVFNGTLKNYSFNYYEGLRRESYHYVIYLNETSESFQIYAVSKNAFKEKEFRNDFRKGDSIIIEYLNPPVLNFAKSVPIVEIKSNGHKYLSNQDSYIALTNDQAVLMRLSLILSIVGITLLILSFTKMKLNNT